jgi:hypothetical protein
MLTDPLLEEWAEWLRAARRAESTIARRIYTVDRFAREVGVSCVSACHDDIVGWFARNEGWAASSAALYFECLAYS